jgi:rhodanese-related sulfurtransferase
MKRILIVMLICLMLTACTQKTPEGTMKETTNQTTNQTEPAYMNITPEEAKKIMDSQSGYVILDVREQDEFDESHIPGAILIPHGQIQELAPSMLPDKDQLILVYCRSGRRSKIAAEALEEMGYTNIKEFGGINDWPYETVGE